MIALTHGSGTIHPAFSFRLDYFNTWVHKQAFPVNKIEVVPDPRTRLQTIAKSDIAEGEIYLRVPTRVIIDSKKAMADPFLGPTFQRLGRRDDLHAIIVYIMHQRFLGKQSAHYAYIQILPGGTGDVTELDNPIFWTDDEVNLLQGSEKYSDIISYRARVKRDWTGLSRTMLSKAPDVFSDSAWFNEDRYRWARATVDSRSIWWGRGERHLVPVLDMINTGEFNGVQKGKPMVPTKIGNDGKATVNVASMRFLKGQSFIEDYGQPNHVLLNFHGFVLKENTYFCLPFKMKQKDFCLRPSDHQGINDAMNYLKKQLGISTKNAISHLSKFLKSKLKSYPTKNKEDKEKLKSLIGRRAMAIRYILQEKNAIIKIRKYLQNHVRDEL
eukprot:UC4_evm4s1428